MKEVTNNKMGLLFSFIFILFLVIIFSTVGLLSQRSLSERYDNKQYVELDLMKNSLQDNSARLEEHIVHVSNMFSLKKYLITREPEYKKGVETFFKKMLIYNINENMPSIDHIRILDLEGREVLRVNLTNDNSVYIVPENELQDKSGKYYFTELQKTPINSAYHSLMDLNKEDNRIEEPYKPVVRFGKPILDETDKKIGYILLNQRYSDVFDGIEKFNIHDGDTWYLLNREGYYLKGDEKSIFGFMWDNENNMGFFSDYKEVWDQYSGHERLKYSTESEIIYLQSLNPYSNTIFSKNSDSKWILVMKTPIKNYLNEFNLLRKMLTIGAVFLVPFFVVIGLLYGRSITKNRAYVEHLKQISTFDDMTGLLNSRTFEERANYLLELNSRAYSPLSLVFIDLNRLKYINDTMGHKFGDLLIKSIGEVIHRTLRATDLAARIGGDEFVICFPQLEVDGANNVMKRISDNFKQVGLKEFGFETTFSYGITKWKEGSDIKSMIKKADELMYLMKRTSI